MNDRVRPLFTPEGRFCIGVVTVRWQWIPALGRPFPEIVELDESPGG